MRHSHIPLSPVHSTLVQLVRLVPVLHVPHRQPFLQGVQVSPGPGVSREGGVNIPWTLRSHLLNAGMAGSVGRL